MPPATPPTTTHTHTPNPNPTHTPLKILHIRPNLKGPIMRCRDHALLIGRPVDPHHSPFVALQCLEEAEVTGGPYLGLVVEGRGGEEYTIEGGVSVCRDVCVCVRVCVKM